MGLIDKIFKKPNRQFVAPGFRTFDDLNPVFTKWDGRIYEKELTRAAIERFATACSKLKPECEGDAPSMRSVRRFIESYPNDFMTWPTMLKRTAAIFDAEGTAFVVPVLANDGETVVGVYPIHPEAVEVLELRGEPWARFHFATGDVSAIELEKVCILTKLQVDSEFFGEKNCLEATMQLMHAQEQAQENAIKNGARIRFIGTVNGMAREDDIRRKRERFIKDNLSSDNESGLMIYDNTFVDVRQVDAKSYTIPTDEMERIESNVCTYFGISMDILQNRYSEDVWGAWYEGRIEPFAVQLGEALSKLCFSPVQRKHGSKISFSANRLSYASNASKRNMVRDMVDRGIFSINEAREVLQLPPVPDGDMRVIRGEYVNAAAVSTMVGVSGGGRLPKNAHEKDFDLDGDDDIYKDSDGHNVDDFDE